MQITPINTNSSNKTNHPNFGWLKIAQGNIIKPLKDGTKKLIPVDICLLRKEDRDLLEGIKDKWTYKTRYGEDIISNFLKATKKRVPKKHKYEGFSYYMLIPSEKSYQFQTPKISIFTKLFAFFKKESPKKQSKPRFSPLCLAEIERVGSSFCLSYIQTAPEVLKTKKQKRLSGCGQMLVYGMTQYINSIDMKLLSIPSTNNGFYSKIFNRENPAKHYTYLISQPNLNEFMFNTQKKYSLEDNKPLSKKILYEIYKNTHDILAVFD